MSYVAFEQVTVAATSIGLTAATINNGNGHPQAVCALLRLQGAQIRFRLDGADPTTTVGTPLEVGDVLSIQGNALLNNFRAIRTGGTSGVLNCTYIGEGDGASALMPAAPLS
ncbi:MAG: hypothetical protein IT429_03140 [Gemmataceae bacterium]|nr:hypothetical protein [Gemmataceae bacterium]